MSHNAGKTVPLSTLLKLTAPASLDLPVCHLEVTEGPAQGKAVGPLEKVTMVGREGWCDLVIDDPALSGRHCEIRLEAGAVRLIDRRSTNGTTLDGHRVIEAFLEDGNTIRIGVENLKVPAYDFVGAVAGDLLSTLVPAAHSPIGTEHQDRVVRDAFEQNLIPPFVILAGRECRCFWHCGVATPRARDARWLCEMRSRMICCRPSNPPTAKGTRNARHLD